VTSRDDALSPFAPEEPAMVVLRWLTTVVLVLFAIFGGFSAYRAWVQVKSLALRTSAAELRPGSSVTVEAVSWARVWVTVRVELVQGDRRELLATRVIPTHHVPSLDPRTVKAWLVIVLTPEQLARLRPGPAMVRATAVGGPQWLRTPPPTVRERAVRIGVGEAVGRRSVVTREMAPAGATNVRGSVGAIANHAVWRASGPALNGVFIGAGIGVVATLSKRR
jgi:hypothetical protein